MGYKRKLYNIRWPEGHDLHGLEVTTKGLSVAKLFELASLGATLKASTAREQIDAAGKLFEGFAGRLVAWNLEEDDGTPIPATLEAVTDQDMQFMIGLIMEWIDAVASVDIPLPNGSGSGESALAASLPMEPLPSGPGN